MKTVKADQLKKLLQTKSKMITLRLNPELLKLLDEALKSDPHHNSRSELIESWILDYLEARKKL
jgi:metal-responsive CopG/Arc/MetJ family transcriptional regulator